MESDGSRPEKLTKLNTTCGQNSLSCVGPHLTWHYLFLCGLAKASLNFLFPARKVFPKSLQCRNSGSEVFAYHGRLSSHGYGSKINRKKDRRCSSLVPFTSGQAIWGEDRAQPQPTPGGLRRQWGQGPGRVRIHLLPGQTVESNFPNGPLGPNESTDPEGSECPPKVACQRWVPTKPSLFLKAPKRGKWSGVGAHLSGPDM